MVVVVVVDGREDSSSGTEDGEYKARMSEAGLSFETATRRTGLLAGLCRRVVDVDVVGKVDEAAEMRARTVLRFVRRVVVRVMVGRSRVVAAVSGVEVILPFLFQRLQLICMLSYVRTGRIYDQGENCSGMYYVVCGQSYGGSRNRVGKLFASMRVIGGNLRNYDAYLQHLGLHRRHVLESSYLLCSR